MAKDEDKYRDKPPEKSGKAKAAKPLKSEAGESKKSPDGKPIAGGRRGRESTHAGKFLYPLVDKNPRREGVPGHVSMGIIMKKPGITVKEFLERGGRLEDLRWDLKKGHVEELDQKKD